MKKAFGQTVREIKREVNKKVLKVPGIERKVLDATSNEPWGPHGSLLADIAQASRNYHEYQMIMSVLWKRVNDTGKNWRHVYKALTVLDYLVAHGSERVIDEIKEHAYQISTLSEFQYIDSSGKDQGSNVRKKSQSLVALVNDKERIQEVRSKAATNRDKFRNAPGDGMYRPGSNSSPGNYGERYDDNQYEARYGNREDDRNGYGREREGAYRDDDQYSSRDGDRYNRDSDDRHSNDYQGRGSTDDHQYSSRSRSSDRERERAYEDDGQYSSRGSGARADDRSQDGSYSDKGIDRKFSEQNLGAPPSYEDAVGDAHSPVQSERDGEAAATFAPVNATTLADPEPGTGPSPASPPAPSLDHVSPSVPAPAPANPVADSFDEFDPRGSFSAPQTTSSGADMDFLGSLSESFSADPLAIMPAPSASAASGVNELDSFASGPAFSATQLASNGTNQGFDDPFGDGPFRALPSADNVSAPPQNHNNSSQAQPVTQNVETPDFGEASSGFTHTPPSNPYSQFPSTHTQFSSQEPTTSHQDIDILADILPLAGPSQVAPQSGFPAQPNQSASVNGFQAQPDQSMSLVPFSVPAGQSGPQTSFPAQPNHPASVSHFPGQPGQLPSMAGFQAQPGQSGPQAHFPVQSGHPSSQFGFPPQISQTQSHTGYSAQVSQPTPQTGFMAHAGQHAQYPAQTGFTGQLNSAGQVPSLWHSGGNYSSSVQQTGYATAPQSHAVSQTAARPAAQQNTANFIQQNSPAASVSSQSTSLTTSGPGSQPNNDIMGNSFPSTTTGSSATVSQPAKAKFEPKSSIWADTLSRGLVDFNISGAKVNPTNNLGIDFDAINRKEKRMEKPTATTATVTSTINMGKAMGSGSGMGRAGAGALRASANPMMNPGMGMGVGPGVNMGMGGGRGMNMGMGGGPGVNMGMSGGPGVNMGMGGGPGANMGMGGYGGMNQPMGGGMNMPGMNMGMNQGMGMNMGMGQGPQMQPTGFPPGATMPGGYNPMMGRGGGGGYGPQQPYGGGFQ